MKVKKEYYNNFVGYSYDLIICAYGKGSCHDCKCSKLWKIDRTWDPRWPPLLGHHKIPLKANCLVSSTIKRNRFETRIWRRAALVFEVLASGTLDQPRSWCDPGWQSASCSMRQYRTSSENAQCLPMWRRLESRVQSQFWHILHEVN